MKANQRFCLLNNAKQIQSEIDSWLKHMTNTHQPVPDFWDECCTSEHLSNWLASSVFCKTEAQ